MVDKYISMQGDDFVTKLLEGERDFRRIKLPKGCDISAPERQNELKKYLSDQQNDLQENPINLIGADLSYVTMKGLFLPYLKARGAHFGHSDFSNCEFKSADFSCSNFSDALFYDVTFEDTDLTRSVFSKTNLESAKFYKSNLLGSSLHSANLAHANLTRGTDVAHAIFTFSNLYRTDLRGVKNLDRADGLERAHFLETRINREDRGVVRKALSDRELIIYKGLFDGFFDQ